METIKKIKKRKYRNLPLSQHILKPPTLRDCKEEEEERVNEQIDRDTLIYIHTLSTVNAATTYIDSFLSLSKREGGDE